MLNWRGHDNYLTAAPEPNTDSFCDYCKNECEIIQICTECNEKNCTCGAENMDEVSSCCHADVVPYNEVEEDWESAAAEHKWECDNER